MIAIGLALLLAPVDMPVAMVANFYKPNDPKTHYQVYLSSLDGSVRKQLTHGNDDFDAVFWQGKSALILVKAKTRWDQSVIQLDIRTGKQTILEPETNSVSRSTPGKYGRARTVLYDSYRLVEWIGSKLHVLKKNASTDYSDNKVELASPDPGNPGRFIAGEKEPNVSIETDGQSRIVLATPPKWSEPRFLDAYNGPDGRTYVVTIKPGENTRNTLAVSQLDWKSATLKPIVSGPDIDFQPGSRWMAYVSARSFQDIDLLRGVWVNRAFIVDRQTGKKTTIAGLVDVPSISLRKLD